jgi:hypothetical protein
MSEEAEKTTTDVRRFRVPAPIFDAYTEVTGDLGRAQDIRDYMEWRAEHPATPLPGKKRGPIRRWRADTRAKRIAEGKPV